MTKYKTKFTRNWTTGWIPRDDNLPVIGSLALWLDASDASTIVASAGKVSQWNDKSGNKVNATQGTASSQPTFTANRINGKSTIVFDGTDDFMNSNLAFQKLSTDAWTWIAVMRSSIDVQQAILGRIRSGGEGIAMRTQTTAISPPQALESFQRTSGAGATTQVFSSANTLPINIAHVVSIQNNLSAGNTTIRIDGAAAGSGSIPGNLNTISDTLYIGALNNNNVAQQFYTGDIAEIIIYNRAISADEMAIIQAYLKNKWGTP